MYLAVKDVKPSKDYQLILTFENGEKRKFDMKPYLDIGIFRELKDKAQFDTVHLNFDTIEWNNEADLDPQDLYKYSEPIIEMK
jgi:hypothetical protein